MRANIRCVFVCRQQYFSVYVQSCICFLVFCVVEAESMFAPASQSITHAFPSLIPLRPPLFASILPAYFSSSPPFHPHSRPPCPQSDRARVRLVIAGPCFPSSPTLATPVGRLCMCVGSQMPDVQYVQFSSVQFSSALPWPSQLHGACLGHLSCMSFALAITAAWGPLIVRL